MAGEPDYIILSSYVLGGIICAYKALQDFKSSVPHKQTNKLRIFVHAMLFTTVVIVVYAGLVNILAGLSPQLNSPYLNVTKGDGNFEKYRSIAPIIIALLFFGATQATIKVGSKEIQLYQKLLHVFTGFLAVPFEKEKILRELTDKKIESLEDFHNQVFSYSKDLGIKQKDNNSEVLNEKQQLNQCLDRMEYLEKIKEEDISIDNAITNLKETLDNKSEGYLEKLKVSAKKLIETNTTNHIFAEFTIKYFDIDPPSIIESESIGGLLTRTFAMSVIGALFIALVVEAFEGGSASYEISTRISILFLSIFFFLIWFVLLDRYAYSFNGLCKAMMLGIAAGFSGVVVFMLVDPNSELAIKIYGSMFLEGWGARISELQSHLSGLDQNLIIKSGLIGSTTSIVVYLFRYQIVPRIRNILVVFCLLPLGGFVLYFAGNLIWIVISGVEFDTALADGFKNGLVVAVLTVVVALVSNVLHREMNILQNQAETSDAGADQVEVADVPD